MQHQVIHNVHCCVFWVPALGKGWKNPCVKHGFFSCCRCRACLSESRSTGGFGSPVMAPEATETHRSWRYVPSANCMLVQWIHFMWINKSCLQPGTKLEQFMSGCGPLTKQQLKYCSNWKHCSYSPIEGSRCVGCTRILSEHWRCRLKLNHNQRLSETLSANKHNRNDVCPSTAAAGLRL